MKILCRLELRILEDLQNPLKRDNVLFIFNMNVYSFVNLLGRWSVAR